MRELERRELDLVAQIHTLVKNCGYSADYLYDIPIKHFEKITKLWNKEVEEIKKDAEKNRAGTRR